MESYRRTVPLPLHFIVRLCLAVAKTKVLLALANDGLLSSACHTMSFSVDASNCQAHFEEFTCSGQPYNILRAFLYSLPPHVYGNFSGISTRASCIAVSSQLQITTISQIISKKMRDTLFTFRRQIIASDHHLAICLTISAGSLNQGKAASAAAAALRTLLRRTRRERWRRRSTIM